MCDEKQETALFGLSMGKQYNFYSTYTFFVLELDVTNKRMSHYFDHESQFRPGATKQKNDFPLVIYDDISECKQAVN